MFEVSSAQVYRPDVVHHINIKHVPLMLDYQKDSGLDIIHNIYYVLFCEMLFY